MKTYASSLGPRSQLFYAVFHISGFTRNLGTEGSFVLNYICIHLLIAPNQNARTHPRRPSRVPRICSQRGLRLNLTALIIIYGRESPRVSRCHCRRHRRCRCAYDVIPTKTTTTTITRFTSRCRNLASPRRSDIDPRNVAYLPARLPFFLGSRNLYAGCVIA